MGGRPRVALATCQSQPGLHDEGPLLLPALADAGVDAEPAVWDDPAVDWEAYDLVVVRSTWDYTLRRDEFLEWAVSVPRLANPAHILAWNTDKRYLAELADVGVPVVPTTFVSPGEAYRPPSYEHVVKPTVSAGARDTARFPAGADSTGHAAALLARGRSVMVQPYQAAVDQVGETAVLSFHGVPSHAIGKAAALAPGAGDPLDVTITARAATPAELDVAHAALEAVPCLDPLLYSRVDLVPGPDGTPLLMELEITEPALFLGYSAGAAQRFAAAICAAL